MTTLEDKILGVKKDYYCSSSESEGEESDLSEEGKQSEISNNAVTQPEVPLPSKWGGSSKNTGPKGVIRDWELYKQLENEKLIDQELQKVAIAKKFAITAQNNDEVDKELMDLMNDEFLVQYRKQRMEEMLSKPLNMPSFGSLLTLKNGNEFLDAIDNEDKSVTIVIHIYEDSNSACKMMNKCLLTLCKQYPSVKFCKMVGSSAGMSHRFKVDGVPAILVYKDGSIIGNFIRITDDLGDEFYDSDVENFLIEHGIINDRYCVPALMQTEEEDDRAGSDWSLE